MNTRRHLFFARARSAFTLIELIGVLAIMTILASVMVPNVLKSIERAAVIAEVETVRKLGEQAKLYLRDSTTQPTNANWNTVLATYAWLSPADILTNKREMNRVYVTDPVAANQRALLISSMRTGLALPSTATIQANFNGIWNWTWNRVTSPTPPGFAAAWTADFSNDYLVIERINYAPIYRTDLQTYTVSLRNLSGVTVSYWLRYGNGTASTSVNILAGASVALNSLYSRDRIELYRAAGAVNLDTTYVVSTTGKTFDFNGTNWLPQ